LNSKLINGYNIRAFGSREAFLDQIKDEKKILIAMNAEKILKNDELLQRIVNSNIGYPDGIGAVMALRQKGLQAAKIPDSEFWLDIVARFKDEKTFYLIGSTQEVINKTVGKLLSDFKGIKIVNYHNGYIKSEEIEGIKKDLIKTKPDVVFVAQGSPRQEFLMEKLIAVHPALYMGLGGSFDVYCGLKKRAPKFLIDFGLEWLFRLAQEPTRTLRYRILLKFFIMLILKKI